MYYIVYKITNLINNKIYIGVHKTKNINDDYMGSGKYLKRAQEKYGIENFEKEILEVFDNAEDMFLAEAEIVNKDFVSDNLTYNLKIGGEGGWDYINSTNINNTNGNKGVNARRKLAERRLIDKDYDLKLKKISSDNFKKARKKLKELYPEGTFKDKKHTEETKKKIGEANSKHQSGTGNSQFGSMWIYSLTEKVSKKIKKEEFIAYEDLGWLKGRKIKF